MGWYMDDYHDSGQFSWHLKILIEAEFSVAKYLTRLMSLQSTGTELSFESDDILKFASCFGSEGIWFKFEKTTWIDVLLKSQKKVPKK